MRAVIVCDDFAFAATAAATLARVGHQAGVNIQWTTKCWPINALSDAMLAENALEDTLDAHLIVFPARCAQSLPSSVLDWLERWARQRRIQAAALGIINYGNSTDLMKLVCPELSTFIRQHHLNFIMDESGVVNQPMKIPIGFSSEGTEPLPIQLPRSLDLTMRNSFRAYGINE